MSALRPYQTRAIDAATDVVNAGKRRLILQAPTGAGKSVIIREMISRLHVNGARACFVAPRREIVEQLSQHLDHVGVDHGVLQGSHWRRRPWLPVQVASVSTLVRRDLEAPDVLFLDEAHLHLDAAKSLVARFPTSIVVGTTATPARLDGRGLGELYEAIVPVVGVRELIDLGFLCPFQVFAPSSPELAGVRTTAGDFNRKDLARVMDTPTIVGDVVETWMKLAAGRSTIVFAVSVEASQKLVEAFRARGVRAAHVDAETPQAERDRVVKALGTGALQVACNVELFTYGLDVPRVSCISVARPTKSLALHLQMLGRGLRTFPGKTSLAILDHAGNTLRHDFPDAPRTWSLNGIERKRKERPPSLRTCTSCYAISPGGSIACTICGVPFPVVRREVTQRAGELVLAQPAAHWRALSEQARARKLAHWLRTKPFAQAVAIFRNVFKAEPSPDLFREAQAMNGTAGGPVRPLARIGASNG